MLERLELILCGCVGKSALNSNRVKSLDENWHTLEQEGALADVIWHSGDVPPTSKVAEEFKSLAVCWSEGFRSDRCEHVSVPVECTLPILCLLCPTPNRQGH